MPPASLRCPVERGGRAEMPKGSRHEVVISCALRPAGTPPCRMAEECVDPEKLVPYIPRPGLSSNQILRRSKCREFYHHLPGHRSGAEGSEGSLIAAPRAGRLLAMPLSRWQAPPC